MDISVLSHLLKYLHLIIKIKNSHCFLFDEDMRILIETDLKYIHML